LQTQRLSHPTDQENLMSVGIIGAGNIGRALAAHAVRAGETVVVANRRGPDSLAELVAELGPGASAGTIAEAAASDIVALAVPWRTLPAAVADLDLRGRIVIDASNPIMPPDFQVEDLHGRTSGEVVAELVPGARLVKAANTLPAAVLAADPREAGGQRVLVLSGDDQAAKDTVAALFAAAGFATIDLGGLADGGRLQDVSGGPFARLNLLRVPDPA
jgi:predicted dinucleotide-binding enzyme